MQVIAATNRADILDPALMRSGRLDRKIEFPHPTEDARAKILQVQIRSQVCASPLLGVLAITGCPVEHLHWGRACILMCPSPILKSGQ